MRGRAAATSQAASAGWSDAVLLERDAELAAIEHALEAAGGRSGSVILLDGPPGIGKSRMLEAARELGEARRMEVLSARARELETGFDFGVCLQLLESRVAGSEPAERERLLAGSAGVAEPLLAEGSTDPASEGQLFSLLHGLYRLCSNLAEHRPLLILVDDVPLADEPSLRFMSYLAQRIEELPVVLVLTSPTVANYRGREGLLELINRPAVSTARLGPLSKAGVASWLRATLFPKARPRFCKACFDATRGNPLLLRELAIEVAALGFDSSTRMARNVSQLGPASIGNAMLTRLRRVGEGAVELALALAVAGDETELRHVAELAGLELSDTGRLADELSAADVLVGAEKLSFVHPIVRRSLYAQLPPAERAEMHLRLAQALGAEGVPEERVAGHLLRATRGGNEWVVETLTVAAARAMVRGAPQAAVRYLRRALDEPPTQEWRSHVMLELGRAEAVAGESEAVERLRSAIDLIADPRGRALTSLDIGRTLYAQGRHRDAAEAFRHGAAEAGEIDRELRLQLHTAYALCARMMGLHAEDLEATAPAPDANEEDAAATPAGRVLLGYMALEEALRGGSREHVLGLAGAALAGGRLIEDETSDGLGPYFAASAMIIAEDLQGAELALTAAIEDARSRGSILGYATACYFRSWATLRRGGLPDSAADAQSALDRERFGWRLGLPGAHAILAESLLERDETAAARRQLELGTLAAATTSEMPLPFLIARKGWFALREGNPEQALDHFLECRRRLEAAGTFNPACIPWRSGAAIASARLGERTEAERLIEEELSLVKAFGAPGAIGRTLLAKADLDDDGIDVLREAVGVLEQSRAALPHARALVALGTALRHAGKRRDAREPLREGLHLAQRCGAVSLVNRARSEALAAGAKPRRAALRGIESLTTRERQVAGLAAQGLSNREIAESLFVTVKTVEWHLRHTYEKLGLASRRELAAALGGGANEA
jgi:DNA-binding CsgD family transcriptional regulator